MMLFTTNQVNFKLKNSFLKSYSESPEKRAKSTSAAIRQLIANSKMMLGSLPENDVFGEFML